MTRHGSVKIDLRKRIAQLLGFIQIPGMSMIEIVVINIPEKQNPLLGNMNDYRIIAVRGGKIDAPAGQTAAVDGQLIGKGQHCGAYPNVPETAVFGADMLVGKFDFRALCQAFLHRLITP